MQKLNTKTGVKSLALRIPPSQWFRVKRLAEKENKSRSFLISQAIEEYLTKKEKV
jgi:predicted transcriptional regulator